MINGTSGVDGTTTTTTGNTKSSVSDANEAQDRFLKLLVAQLNNQDPMNPMDNAQMTSQMAQINTVTGIQQLNQTMQSMSSQFVSMQMLQGTSMIGRTVLTEGNTLGTAADGTHTAAFDLEGKAASVKVQITTASGELVDTIDLGAGATGRNYFTWDGADKYSGDKSQLRYSVQATNGATAVASTPLSPHAVIAASASNGQLMLELDDGSSLAHSAVKAVY
ncbi:flagellar hook assembly protein FlgD [Comamonas sp. 26]|uniref:flagellar hook assembly protein FlgD n=1 Tax=Comamonas sp. 26 TaxID=2035201 RepID=UPI000C196DA9|nr:flagellar hook capping FlgD N-terminal domain-containing protein [Comamonas sp. 26]PIF98857.1 flagellar basal-body rod modification protein FlgD [Comamonas sp. 26]